MKITTLDKLHEIVKQHKSQGKKIGLITGCFDIIHIGHIELFRFAKKQCDIVIVGLENDETIKLSKGEGRPINKLKYRCEVLADIVNIDYVFPLEIFNFNDDDANKYLLKVTKILKPNCLITNPVADRFWKEKEKRAKNIGAELLKDDRSKISSSTQIIDKLSKEL